ncbi:MAG: glycosyltransferase [Clostridia bacterium]|jgi:glycosyltransferase involved in cell wall biosynthesis
MKKLLFAAYSLDVGGIEKALVNLVNVLQNRGYDITVVLEKKQGIFLNELNKNIKLIEYTPSEKKNLIVRKITNFIHRIQFIIKYKNKYDFSAAFATYSKPSIFVSKVASKNNTLWGHADYLTLFDNDRQKVKDFFKSIKVEQFKNIIFVSEEGKNSFLDIFPQMKEKTIECNNIVNNKEILKLSEEEIEIKKDNKCFTFLNVGRHDEKQKKLTRIIEAVQKLKQDDLNFKVLFVGDGKDNTLYRKMVKDKKLENNIIFVGPQKNPYPYFKISDCVILTSDYEGYPVVFLESFILNKPIITTKVSDYKDIEGKYGYITSKQIDDIYEKMKEMIKNGYEIKESFDADKYNNDIIEKLEKIF